MDGNFMFANKVLDVFASGTSLRMVEASPTDTHALRVILLQDTKHPLISHD